MKHTIEFDISQMGYVMSSSDKMQMPGGGECHLLLHHQLYAVRSYLTA